MEADSLVTRVSAEFNEMPGLRLTLPQATRLLGLEPAECERVINHLVGERFLRPKQVGKWSCELREDWDVLELSCEIGPGCGAAACHTAS